MRNKLTTKTIETLKSYVYVLKDPKTNEVFYVGKGKGGRVLSHLHEAIKKTDIRSDKLDRIRKIIKEKNLEMQVLRHGLTNEEAIEVEASVIEILNDQMPIPLTNKVTGHDTDERGLMSIEDIEIKYQAEPAKFKHKAVLITVNKFYKDCKTPEELYDRTRSAWSMDIDRARNAEIVCCLYKQIIREVYVPKVWNEHPERANKQGKPRVEFIGGIAPNKIRDLYRKKSVGELVKHGSANPIRYAGGL